MDSRDTERGFSTNALTPQEYEIMEPEEDFDAFNGDTFGNDAETWTKEDHDQLVGAHITEVRNGMFRMPSASLTLLFSRKDPKNYTKIQTVCKHDCMQ